jgi:putative FmdB family regulatory protein
MPIYAYRCAACGHAKDVLQKLSDAQLTTCPACGAETFTKQVTAAGFQLKGSGWYATDFKGGPATPEAPSDAPAAADAGTAVANPAATSPTATAETTAAKPASNSPVSAA